MYSIVLMAAIGTGPGATGADQPGAMMAAPPVMFVGCAGCTGCTGYAVASCYGCCGGRAGFLGHKQSCHGGCGGVVASSCHGCCGGVAYSSCHGGGLFHRHHAAPSYGCCGGSCSGFTAGCWGSCTGTGSAYGYGPSTHFYPTYATPIQTGAAPFYYTPGTHSAPPVEIPQSKIEGQKGASLKFNLPAGAVLFVDGQKTPGEGTDRSFFTPALDVGQKYFYDVRAEILIDGKTIVEEKRVVVEAGAQISESFPKMIAAVAASTTVAGK